MIRRYLSEYDRKTKPESLNDWSDNYNRKKCLSGLTGRFNSMPIFLLDMLMRYVKEGKPFAWIRWGDGETIHACRTHKPGIRLKNSCKLWQEAGDNFFVAVGTWFFLNPKLKQMWNFIHKNNKLDLLVLLEYFYLPMGDPACDEYLPLRKNGILGWIIESTNRKKVIVGPNFAKQFEFLEYYDFIEIGRNSQQNIDDYDIIHSKMKNISENNEEGILFIFIAGFMSKVLITEAFTTYGKKDTFIDVGSALDGYAGIESKDFINCKKWAKKIIDYIPPDDKKRKWMQDKVFNKYKP